jgi:hypothetical protein
MTTYVVGQTIIIVGTFTDADDVLTDPVTVVLTVRSPSGIVTTPTFTNPSVGVYESVVTLDEVGIWRWEWEGTTLGVTAISPPDGVCAERSMVSV